MAFALEKKVEDVLPMFVFAFLICLFGLALVKKPHHAFELSLVGFAFVWAFYIFKKRRILPSLSDIKSMFPRLPVGLVIYFGVLLVMWYAYGNHVVNNWDDFHFNATFARDMYVYNGMPTGWKAATGYKSYKPFMQMFYNWGFQATGGYNEPLMFRYKSFLIYTTCLPLFSLVDKAKGIIRKIGIAVMAVILPYAFMFELVDSLSMDGLMGLLCAYSLVAIVFPKERDWFCYVKIAIGLISLTLVKSSAVMFTAICIAVWFVVELFEILWSKKTAESIEYVKFRNKRIMIFGGVSALTGAFWLAWKIFCDVNGNVTFLNNILDSHLDNNSGLPWFGKDTIINGIKQLFTLKMNLGSTGLTFMTVVLIVLIICIFLIRSDVFPKVYHFIYFILFGAIIPYVAVLLYTYIYVFFEYEAIALASYDRYLGTYALALLYFAFFHVASEEKSFTWGPGVIALVILLTLNYPRLYEGLIPSVYAQEMAEIIIDRNEAEEEMARVMPPDADAEMTLIVSNENQTIYGRGLDLAALPLVANEVVVKTLECELVDEIAPRLADENIKYVYFCEQISYDDIKSCDVLATDGVVAPGTMYRYNEDTNLLERVE